MIKGKFVDLKSGGSVRYFAVLAITAVLVAVYLLIIFFFEKDRRERRVNYLDCLTVADESFEAKWASQCKINYLDVQDCFVKFSYSKTMIDTLCMAGDRILAVDRPDCILPEKQKEGINTRYEEAQRLCNEKFPQQSPRQTYTFGSKPGSLRIQRTQ